ncbi:MAG: hypothetical protein ACJAZ2_001296, partial [Glaciecola sp.]
CLNIFGILAKKGKNKESLGKIYSNRIAFGNFTEGYCFLSQGEKFNHSRSYVFIFKR